MMAETTDDLVNAESLLERALYCFQQIGDVALCSKARANIASVRFRASLEDGVPMITNGVDELEVTAAKIMEGLLAENIGGSEVTLHVNCPPPVAVLPRAAAATVRFEAKLVLTTSECRLDIVVKSCMPISCCLFLERVLPL
jgi:hypothetical protein